LEKVDIPDTPEEEEEEDEDWEVDPEMVRWPEQKISDGRVTLRHWL